MPVNASISINFEAEDTAAVDKVIRKLKLPPGANVHASVSETVLTGVADDAGDVAEVAPPPPAPEEVTP